MFGSEPAAQPTVEHQGLDDVARDVRLSDEPDELGLAAAGARRAQQGERALLQALVALDDHAPATLEERLARPEAAAARERRDDRLAGAPHPGRATRRGRRARAGSPRRGGVSGSSFALTSGFRPAPRDVPLPPRLRPLGRKYWPTVMSSAPPLSSSTTSWKTPLPYVRVPTSFARSRSWSAPATISDADALARSTSTVTGVFGSDGVAGRAVDLLLYRAPARRDHFPFGQERAGDEPRLLDEPARVGAQVEHDARDLLLLCLAQRLVQLGVRAAGEALEADDRVLLAVLGVLLRRDGRDRDLRALDAPPEPLLATPHREHDLGAGGSLDQAGRRVLGLVGELLVAGGEDDVALAQPGLLGGRAVVDPADAQPVLGRRHGHPDAGEARLGDLTEARELLRIEVVREAVAEPLDRAADRVVGELLLADRAVEVVAHLGQRVRDLGRRRRRRRAPAAGPGARWSARPATCRRTALLR